MISKIKLQISNSGRGFTLLEIVIVIFILGSLAAVSLPAINTLALSTDLDSGMRQFTTALKLAQSKTVSSETDSQYGVYMDTGVFPNKFVIYKGATYAGRDASYDQHFWLPKTVEFSGISLGGGSEVVFEKLTGYALQSGSIAVRMISNTAKLKTVYISGSGVFSEVAPGSITDTRAKDSRHVHVDYSRVIDTNTESITLLFDGTVSQVIPLVSNMSNGQIEWTGTVTAGGSPQTVRVHTHRLNSADTQFSIHRDGSLNNKTLRITISGDATGNVLLYSADGQTTSASSFYASNLIWQ